MLAFRKIYNLLLPLLLFFGNLYHGFSQDIKPLYTRKMYCIAIENDSIWVGGKHALFKLNLNGDLIKKYTQEDGLPEGPYYSIAIDNGEKWIATDKGICILKNGSFILIDSINNNPISSISVINTDIQGNKWVGTKKNGLCKFDGTSWVTYNMMGNNIYNYNISAIYCRHDTVWIATENDIFYWYNNSWENINAPLNGKLVVGMAADKSNLYFGFGNYVYRYDFNVGSSFHVNSFFDTLSCLKELNNGEIWASSHQYTILVNNNSYHSGIRNNMNNIEIDKNGATWILSDHLHYITESIYRRILLDDDQMGSNSIKTIDVDYSDNLWIGSHSDGVSKFNGTSWKNYNGAEMTAYGFSSILPLPDSSVWIGTGNYFKRIKNDSAVFLKPFDNSHSISCITKDLNNNIWVGNYGIAKYDGKNWTQYNYTNEHVNSIFFDKANVLWAGTNTGLISYDGKTWKNHDFFLNKKVTKVCADKSGDVWCFGSGWYYNVNNGTIFYYKRDNPNDYVVDARFDSLNLWILTDYAMNKYDGTNWVRLKFTHNTFTTLPVKYDGKLLFGTAEGVFYMEDTCLPMTDVGKIICDTIFCENKMIHPYIKTFPKSDNYCMMWSFPDGTDTTISNSYSFSWQPRNSKSGLIKVRYANICGISNVVSQKVVVKPLPSKLYGLSGKFNVCAGEKGLIYTVNPDSLSKHYSWSLLSRFIGNSTNSSITVSIADTARSGLLIVNGVNECGTGISDSKLVAVTKNKPVIDSIYGKSIICTEKQNYLFSVNSKDTGLAYNWLLPPGTTAVYENNKAYLQFYTNPGYDSIKVISTNSCGSTENQIQVKHSLMYKPSIFRKWENLILCKDSGSIFRKKIWYYNGNVMSDYSNKQYFVAKSDGLYKIVVSNEDGCVDSAEIDLTNLMEAKVVVSPNPFQNYFNLHLNSEETGVIQLSIFNMNGVKVKEFSLEKNQTSSDIIIDSKGMNSGIYVVHYNINGRQISELKILKN